MAAPDILVLNQKIHGMSPRRYRDAIRDRLPDAEVQLAATPAERRERLPSSRVVTGYQIPAEELARADALDLFACTFAGTDHLPLEALAEHDVAVTSASGVHGPNAAEQVLGYLLAFTRRLDRAWAQTRSGIWQHYQTAELHGSTVTVVGMGTIGTAILERLAPFGVERIGVRHTPEKDGPADRIVGYEAFLDVVPESDALVLACPLTDLTRGLVDAQVLDLLPPNAILVNIARGPVVNTGALVGALQGNAISAAALDVTDPEPLPHDHPLWDLDRCLLTPHNAGHTPQYWERCADLLATNYRRLDMATNGAAELHNRAA
jgi:phosphoglycerate dehydrogenase-like enzyme